MTPYDILKVAINSDDENIRKSYLKLVRQFPPDLFPEEFKKISNAYSQIKDEKTRIKYYLFDKSTPGNSLSEIMLNMCRENSERKPLNLDYMQKFLMDCSEAKRV